MAVDFSDVIGPHSDDAKEADKIIDTVSVMPLVNVAREVALGVAGVADWQSNGCIGRKTTGAASALRAR